MKQPEAVKIFSLLNLFWGIWGAPFGFFVAIYLAQTGVSDSNIGLLFGVNSLMGLVVAFPSGILSDRFNPVRAMLVGLIITAPFYFAITLTDSFLLLLLFFVLDSFGANLYSIAADSTMYRAIESTKGKAFGTVHLLNNLGVAAGALVGGYAIAYYGFRGLGLLALLPIIAVIALALQLPRAKVKLAKLSLSSYLQEFRRKEFLLLAVVAFLLAYHWGTEKTSFPLYASNILFLSSQQLGLLFFLNLLIYAIGGLLAGRLIDISKHRTRLFILGLVISAAGSLLYSSSYDFGSALLARLLHDSGDAMLGVSLMFAISVIAGRERMGGAVGAMYIIYILANFTGAVASGYINQYFGYPTAIQVSALLTLASAAVLALTVLSKISKSPFAAKSKSSPPLPSSLH